MEKKQKLQSNGVDSETANITQVEIPNVNVEKSPESILTKYALKGSSTSTRNATIES